MSQRVFITGFGIITSIGKNAEENLHSLIHGNVGYGELNVLNTVHKNSLAACEIKIQDNELSERAGTKPHEGFTRTALLGLLSLQEAIRSAGLSNTEVQSSGLISATTTGGIREFEKYYHELMNPEVIGEFQAFTDTATSGEHCERIADHLGIKKYLATISTACSS